MLGTSFKLQRWLRAVRRKCDDIIYISSEVRAMTVDIAEAS